MFDKKAKAYYSLNSTEKQLVEHFAAQIAMGQMAMQKFLNDIGARERIPPQAVFDPARLAFVKAPEEKKEA